MRKQSTIQRFFSSFLLAVCVLSFLPKTYFHDAVANHTDALSCSHPLKQTDCVHAKGFHCGFTDLVVNTPYELATNSYTLTQPLSYLAFKTAFVSAAFSNVSIVAESRGPPTAV